MNQSKSSFKKIAFYSNQIKISFFSGFKIISSTILDQFQSGQFIGSIIEKSLASLFTGEVELKETSIYTGKDVMRIVEKLKLAISQKYLNSMINLNGDSKPPTQSTSLESNEENVPPEFMNIDVDQISLDNLLQPNVNKNPENQSIDSFPKSNSNAASTSTSIHIPDIEKDLNNEPVNNWNNQSSPRSELKDEGEDCNSTQGLLIPCKNDESSQNRMYEDPEMVAKLRACFAEFHFDPTFNADELERVCNPFYEHYKPNDTDCEREFEDLEQLMEELDEIFKDTTTTANESEANEDNQMDQSGSKPKGFQLKIDIDPRLLSNDIKEEVEEMPIRQLASTSSGNLEKKCIKQNVCF